jgi:hypothetical protein
MLWLLLLMLATVGSVVVLPVWPWNRGGPLWPVFVGMGLMVVLMVIIAVLASP